MYLDNKRLKTRKYNNTHFFLSLYFFRIASMQDAVREENKPSILSENIRNLRKSTTTSKLWLIDNESGLFDAYDLMYNAFDGEKFIDFHKDMLKTFCIFPKTFIDSLRHLYSNEHPHLYLEAYAMKHEPLIREIIKDGTHHIFTQHFQGRIKDILNWVDSCAAGLS